MRLLQCSAKPGALEKFWMFSLCLWLTEVLQHFPQDLDPCLGGWMSPSVNTQKCFDLEKRLLSFMSSRGVVAQLQTQQGHEWNFHSKTVRCLYPCNVIAAFYCFIRDAAGWEPTSILLTQLFKAALFLSLHTRGHFCGLTSSGLVLPDLSKWSAHSFRKSPLEQKSGLIACSGN